MLGTIIKLEDFCVDVREQDLEFWEYLTNSVICRYFVYNNKCRYGNMEELTSYLGMLAI
jgi:hypothetical protein